MADIAMHAWGEVVKETVVVVSAVLGVPAQGGSISLAIRPCAVRPL